METTESRTESAIERMLADRPHATEEIELIKAEIALYSLQADLYRAMSAITAAKVDAQKQIWLHGLTFNRSV